MSYNTITHDEDEDDDEDDDDNNDTDAEKPRILDDFLQHSISLLRLLFTEDVTPFTQSFFLRLLILLWY